MPRHQTPWHQDPVVLARLPEVERRHLAGQPNTAIAAVLGVDEITIRRDLKRIADQWLTRLGQQADVLRAEIVGELDDVRRRALDAARFDEMAERAVLFDDTDENGARVERPDKGSVSFKGGKAQALNTARQASMDKAKVLGLIVEKLEHGGEGLVRIYERGSEQQRLSSSGAGDADRDD